MLCAPCNVAATGKGSRGFCDGDSGVLYLLSRKMLSNSGVETAYLKIGITNKGKAAAARMRKHRRSGWELLDSRVFTVGRDARVLETKVKSRLDALSIPRGTSLFSVKFDGYTETWRAQDSPAETLAELFDALGIPKSHLEGSSSLSM